MEILNYKCPCCGAPLKFNGQEQKMVCEFCDNAFTAEQLKEYDDVIQSAAAQSEFQWTEGEQTEIAGQLGGMTAYSCTSCGAEIIGDENTAAAQCPYCGNTAIVTKQLSGVNKPDLIIPFKVTKGQAMEALEQFYKGKRLLPNFFKTKNHVEKITGMYVPFWLFNCEADANMVYDATTTETWSDSAYNYIKTNYFTVFRQGHIGFEKIPVDGSKKMDDDFMDSIEPFDYSEAIPFDASYLSGYFADKYDVDASHCMPRANDRVTNSVDSEFRRTVTGYSSVTARDSNVQIANGNVKYALLPVWVLNTEYKGKTYTFAMNGQTGKLIGDLPVDRGKYWKWFGGLAAALMAIGQLFIFLT